MTLKRRGAGLAYMFAHARVALIGVDCVALQNRKHSFWIMRREPKLGLIHATAITLAGLAFDMFFAGVLDGTALYRDPEKVLVAVRDFARAQTDGSTTDAASKIIPLPDELLVLALPIALNAAWRALDDYQCAMPQYEIVAVTFSGTVPDEKCVLITREFIAELRNRRRGKAEIVNFREWYDNLPEDLIARRAEETLQAGQRVVAEMVRLGQIRDGKLTEKGLQRLALNEL